MVRRVAMFCLLALFLLAGSAGAGDLKGLLNQAGQLADQGQIFQAASTLRAALAEVWSLKPMGIKGASLVAQKAGAYGQYQPRPNNVYQKGEPILIYVEPAGYRFKKQGEMYTFGFSADFAVLSEDGKVLGGQKNFNRWQFSSREPLFEVYVNLTYNLTGAPPGTYLMQTTLHDANGGGDVSFKLPVVIK